MPSNKDYLEGYIYSANYGTSLLQIYLLFIQQIFTYYLPGLGLELGPISTEKDCYSYRMMCDMIPLV